MNGKNKYPAVGNKSTPVNIEKFFQVTDKPIQRNPILIFDLPSINSAEYLFFSELTSSLLLESSRSQKVQFEPYLQDTASLLGNRRQS